MKATRRYAAGLAAVVATVASLLAATGLGAGAAGASSFPAFVGPLHHITTLASTVPANGDVNPYGVAVIPHGTGHLGRGNILVSNFNNKANVQGTGTTIVQITPHGHVSLFAKVSPHLRGCPGGVGLTTALTVLRSGWVIVGSLPTKGGSVSGSGCLIVLDRWGHVRETFTGRHINSPWDMTSADFGRVADLFVTNVLNGTVATVHRGTVARILLVIPPGRMPFIVRSDIIGSGFGEHLDPAALVIGPTGVGLGRNGTLYVADTVANRIAAIPRAVFRISSAGRGATVSRGHALNGPLGLVVAPGGDILTVNSGNGNLVEVTPFGLQVAVRALDVSGSPPGAGALFGLAVKPHHRAVYFVDDATNTFALLHH
jgi:sugar lactone lactonase YvrE